MRNRNSEIFIPDSVSVETAFRRTTHMAIAAHQDDIEIMALDGILKCFGSQENWFFGVVVTNGSGSARNNIYAGFSDEEMQRVRRNEQKKAAYVGEYSGVALLDYTSAMTKDVLNTDIIDDIRTILTKAKPKVVYTHNLADKHDTHVGVAIKTINAIRGLSEELRPKHLYGCEVWRSLDWINDDEKVVFDVEQHSNVSAALVEVFDSQICGAKRYDLATMGRRLANATYGAPHTSDASKATIYGIDLTPLIKDTDSDIEAYIIDYINRFSMDVSDRIKKLI